jgi:hypothetical protein
MPMVGKKRSEKVRAGTSQPVTGPPKPLDSLKSDAYASS